MGPLRFEPLKRAGVVASYLAGHFSRRDPSLWVFGNVKGFRDNPRYLAEHVLHAHPDIHVCWIARSAREADRARAAGLPVAVIGGDAAAIQRRARVAFVSNGFQDLEAGQLGGAFVVDLRHGQGTKRILLESPQRRGKAGSYIRRATRWLERAYVRLRLAQIDMIVAPGEQERAMYAKAFGGSPSRIRVLGSPRFDVLLGGDAHDRVAGRGVRERLGLQADDYLVAWLPTWRDDDDAGWFPPLDVADLDRELAGTDIVLVVKLHPYTNAAPYAQRLPHHDRIRWVPDDETDVNRLLRAADALVTDYSSAAFDFALLERPILFFAPDMDTYRRGDGLLRTFERLIRDRYHPTWSSLFAALRDTASGGVADPLDTAREIRAMSRNMDEPGSCERIVRAVADAVGLPVRAAR